MSMGIHGKYSLLSDFNETWIFLIYKVVQIWPGLIFFKKNHNYQGRKDAAQCGLFTQKSVPVIFEPPCIKKKLIFHEYPSSGNPVVPCGRTVKQTDMAKLIVAFRNFAHAPKNWHRICNTWWCLHLLCSSKAISRKTLWIFLVLCYFARALVLWNRIV
jgi:hypothetical protein